MDETTVRDLLLVSAFSWSFHPGYNRPDSEPPALEEIFELVESVLEERRRRWPGLL